MNYKQKRSAIRQMDTDAIRRIVTNTPNDEQPTPEQPLAGQVNLPRIGHVPVTWLRSELERRERA